VPQRAERPPPSAARATLPLSVSNWAETAKRLMAVIKAAPPAKPSIPSIRLMALVIYPQYREYIDSSGSIKVPKVASMRMPLVINKVLL